MGQVRRGMDRRAVIRCGDRSGVACRGVERLGEASKAKVLVWARIGQVRRDGQWFGQAW